MVPAWKMLTGKRIGLQQKGSGKGESGKGRLSKLKDFLRLKYPLKFDFCRMTPDEITRMVDRVLREDRENPGSFKPVVAIGHTKDLVDFATVESCMIYLAQKGIQVSTFREVYDKCAKALDR